MARKRAAQHDWVCRRCHCPCNPPGGDPVHLGGGRGMKSCGTPDPVRRSVLEAECDRDATAAAAALRHLWGKERPHG